jgi:pyruvate kinase
MNRRAKIVCTIGPASNSPSMMRSMILNGMDVARFNFSHGGPNMQQEHIANLRAVSDELGKPVALLQDLQGPKIRTGPIAGRVAPLEVGQTFTLTTRGVEGNEQIVSTTYQALPRDCRRGDTILLDDGLIALHVDDVTDTDVICTVTDGGVLKPNKGINLPGVRVSAPALSDKDRHDVEWGIANDLDYVALSFVRQADEVRELKEMVKQRGKVTQIIAKLEKPEAIDNLEEIIEASDGVMVARGDLGVEMPPEEVPLLQKRIIKAANEAGKVVITATQMLESMTTTQRPTRAEASDVANAVLDGTDAVMLSGETASGAYPLESLQMMARIVREVEASRGEVWGERRPQRRSEATNFTVAICEAAAQASAAVNARAIACFTETGSTARRLAKFRPPVPIIAFTPDPTFVRQLKLVWGVQPHLIERSATTDAMILYADSALLDSGDVAAGDPVVITFGTPVAQHGATNTMKLHRIGEVDVI